LNNKKQNIQKKLKKTLVKLNFLQYYFAPAPDGLHQTVIASRFQSKAASKKR
jgi:hypothetical protein